MLVSDGKRPKIEKLQKRANLPKYVRVAAIVALCLTILAIGIGFYRAGNHQEFRLKPEHAQLSKDVVAEVNGYERTETDGNVKKFYIKADKARTFTDNHQELENVFLEVFNEESPASDKITAEKAIYIPAENKNFTAYFAGNVNIATRDNLKVKTEQINYTKETETAEADELVEFERENVSGKSFELSNVPVPQLESQKATAGDSLQRSFGALMLSLAEGDRIDMNIPLKQFSIQLTSVDSYAHRATKS